MSPKSESPRARESRVKAGRESIAALRDEARTLGRMPFKVRDEHVHRLHRLLDQLAAQPSPDAERRALREAVEKLPTLSTRVYSSVEDALGRVILTVDRADVLALLTASEER